MEDDDEDGAFVETMMRNVMNRTSGTVVDIQLDLALNAANSLSIIAKSEGDLPTMYAANRAWHELHQAQEDRAKRVSAIFEQ